MYHTQNKPRTAKRFLDLIHSDICDTIQTKTIGRKKYFLTFIDDFNRFSIIYCLSKMSEVLTKLKEHISMAKRNFSRKIQTLRSDNGGEYTSREVENCLSEIGIQHQFTLPRCPQRGFRKKKLHLK